MREYMGLSFIIAVLALAGCGRGAANSGHDSAALRGDSLPEEVRAITDAVASDDSTAFAALVNYPLERPYPLHAIRNPREMAGYYHTLVDDSLKRVITRGAPGDWHQFGWRGWSVGGGDYLWSDSIIYSVPYVSAAERATIECLRREEIMSLHASLRGDWVPVTTLQAPDGSLFRIDAHPGADLSREGALRLMAYHKDADLHGMPDLRLSGFEGTDGSEMSVTYEFVDSNGEKYIFDIQPADSDSPRLTREDAEGRTISSDLKQVYWLDLPGH